MNDNLREFLAELRHYFQQLYGERLVQLILYGSQARGDAKPDSDIDILVVLDGQIQAGREIARTSEFIAALCLDKTVVISSAFASAIRFQQEKSPFFLNVRREGVPI
jgi:predicted nucleotidyltransferase